MTCISFLFFCLLKYIVRAMKYESCIDTLVELHKNCFFFFLLFSSLRFVLIGSCRVSFRWHEIIEMFFRLCRYYVCWYLNERKKKFYVIFLFWQHVKHTTMFFLFYKWMYVLDQGHMKKKFISVYVHHHVRFATRLFL